MPKQKQESRRVMAPANVRCNRNHPKSPANRAQKRRDEAAARQAIYDGLTLEQKIERVASRPGNSKRETVKLLHQAEAEGKVAFG